MLEAEIVVDPQDRYFLISPLAGSVEGRYGRDSLGVRRPVAAVTCGTVESASPCK